MIVPPRPDVPRPDSPPLDPGGSPSAWWFLLAGFLPLGGVVVLVGAFLPWVASRHTDGRWWWHTGMDLTYAHRPEFPLAYVAIVAGILAMGLGLWGIWLGRRLLLALGSAWLMALLLAFVAAFLDGRLADQVRSFPGWGPPSLTFGFWVMVLGTALVVLGSVGAGSPSAAGSPSRPDV